MDYNSILISIQEREKGAWEKLVSDKNFYKLFNSYCSKYAREKNTRQFRETLEEEIFKTIADRYKPKVNLPKKVASDYAWRYLKAKLYYKIMDLLSSESKYRKRHTEFKDLHNTSSSSNLSIEATIRRMNLPAMEKIVLVLKVCYAWKNQEIAELINKSPSYVTSVLKSIKKNA